ncbi:MAG: shikimate dehydrogenase [Sedimentisphaerales bacterium]|nr:shikimate dehydrogenase [Sedimentisphaerales bacterium]
MTYLAIPIKVESAAVAQDLIAQAAQAGADIIELRLDYLTIPTADAVRQVVAEARQTGCKVLATCRADWEGGSFKGSEKGRNAILKQAVRAGADYVDIESACRADGEIQIESILGKTETKLIRSNHDFNELPGDWDKRLARLAQQQPDIAKIAYKANKITDCFAALDWLHSQQQQKHSAIAMAMGEAGTITRLLAKKLGAFLTFASLGDEQATAPGQVTAKDIRQLYRFDAVNAQTKLFGVVACPVGHSMSPAIHNAAFAETDFDGLYVPLLVAPHFSEFQGMIHAFCRRQWLHLRGLSVTIPHKENALRYLQTINGKIDSLAAKIGAVNTMIFSENGEVSGCNTDYPGALKAIMDGAKMGQGDFKGLPTAIFGAGGVARALVVGLTDLGANVTIYNRTAEKAEKLAAEFGCEAAPLEAIGDLDAKLIINCTSLGMTPNTNQCCVGAEAIKPGMIVFDTVYNPLQTQLLNYARAAGAVAIDGLTMFVNQAALQFELFTGQNAPTDIMRQVVLERL